MKARKGNSSESYTVRTNYASADGALPYCCDDSDGDGRIG